MRLSLQLLEILLVEAGVGLLPPRVFCRRLPTMLAAPVPGKAVGDSATGVVSTMCGRACSSSSPRRQNNGVAFFSHMLHFPRRRSHGCHSRRFFVFFSIACGCNLDSSFLTSIKPFVYRRSVFLSHIVLPAKTVVVATAGVICADELVGRVPPVDRTMI